MNRTSPQRLWLRALLLVAAAACTLYALSHVTRGVEHWLLFAFAVVFVGEALWNAAAATRASLQRP